MIIKKRTDIEYKINAAFGGGGSSAGPEKTDFLRYIKFESNLDLLLKNRLKRNGEKTYIAVRCSITVFIFSFNRKN